VPYPDESTSSDNPTSINKLKIILEESGHIEKIKGNR
jgi:hypothetical protein